MDNLANIPSNWRKHKPRAATEAQIRALQIAYKRLLDADDPRADIGIHRVPDERANRLRWAWHRLGHEITSFSEITLAEAQYLLDYCNGVKTKLDAEIDAEFQRLGVIDQAAYFDAMCAAQKRSKNFWHFNGRRLGKLSRYDKWRLVSMLKTRVPARAVVSA